MNFHHEWLYFAAASLSFGLCYLLTPLCLTLSGFFGLLDKPGGHKAHEQATPLMGGVAIFSSVWLVLLGLVYQGFLSWGLELRGLLIGSSVVFAMGLVDDLRGLPAFTKFVVQIGAAVIVVLHGTVISLFIGYHVITILITILWIVGITNSFNLLDNMDGLTAGVAAICCLVFSIIGYRQQDYLTVYLAVSMLGALVAFLRFNFEPAELFMGDAGSGFIGFFMATLAVSSSYLQHTQLRHLPIITPLLIFSVPLFDTFSVMVIRILEGRPIWEADNSHFSHRLVSLGLSRRSAVLVIYLVTFSIGILATMLTRVNRTDAILLLIHGVSIFVIIILLEFAAAAIRRKN
ncbi:MAG: MraY family glycosyltransferase [bacterium]